MLLSYDLFRLPLNLILLVTIILYSLFDHRVTTLEFPCFILVALLCHCNDMSFHSVSITYHSGVFFWPQIATVKDCSHHVWCYFLYVEETSLGMFHDVFGRFDPFVTGVYVVVGFGGVAVRGTLLSGHILVDLLTHLGVHVSSVLFQ
jgi:hypothetical protein